jgi:prolyl-tRNA synthetase
MGSYGIGVGRLLASIAEEHNDEAGCVWPVSVAVHRPPRRAQGRKERPTALYDELEAAGIDVSTTTVARGPASCSTTPTCSDSRSGLTLSKRSLEQGGVETKLRHESDRGSVALDAAVEWARMTATELARPLGERADAAPTKAD